MSAIWGGGRFFLLKFSFFRFWVFFFHNIEKERNAEILMSIWCSRSYNFNFSRSWKLKNFTIFIRSIAVLWCFCNNIQIWLERRVFDFLLCLKMRLKAEVIYFENLKKKLGYKRLQLCSWKKYFSKIWKGAQQGYFCRNFKLAYRDKFLIFLYTWNAHCKLKCSILIMSKKNWDASAYKCVLEKKQFSKKTFFKKKISKYFFSRAHLQALVPHFFMTLSKYNTSAFLRTFKH